jgi:hypothetical protein
MKEALGSSETSVLTRATLRNIKEDTILNLETCKMLGFHVGDYEEWRLLGVRLCDSCKNRRFLGKIGSYKIHPV